MGQTSEKSGTLVNDLLGIRFRRKGSQKIDFLLKRTPINGYLKCQLCKIKFKINEVEEHLTKQKHTRKVEDVSMILNSSKDNTKPLPVSTRVISSSVPLGAKTTNATKMHEINVRTIPTTNQETRTTVSKIPQRILNKTVQQSDINSKKCLNILSNDTINCTKQLFSNIDKKEKYIQCYDIENNWKVLILQAGKRLGFCIYANGVLKAFIPKTSHLFSLSSEHDYTSLASIYRSVLKQPHDLLQHYCNIHYRIWPTKTIEQNIDHSQNVNTNVCLTSSSNYEESSPTLEQKVKNLSMDFAYEIQYLTLNFSELQSTYGIFKTLGMNKLFEKNLQKKNENSNFANKSQIESPDQNSQVQTAPNVIKTLESNSAENESSNNDEAITSLHQTTLDYKGGEAELCKESLTSTSDNKNHVTKLEEQPRTIHAGTIEGIQSVENSEQRLSNNGSNSVKSLTFQQFRDKYIQLGIDQLVHIKFTTTRVTTWLAMVVQQRGGRYFCNLCRNYSSPKDIEAHVRGARHARKKWHITGLYHPIFFKNLGETIPIIPPVSVSDQSKSVESNLTSTCAGELPKTMKIEQFKREYVHMNIPFILQIRYCFGSSDWEDLLTFNQNRYYCRLCGNVPLGGTANVKLHLSGRRHTEIMDLVTQIYHPSQTFEGIQKHLDKYESSDEHEEGFTDSSGHSESTHLMESSICSDDSDTPVKSFKRNCAKLDISELLKVKYRTARSGTTWISMIFKSGDAYFCNLCGRTKPTGVGDHKNVKQHVSGARHMHKLDEVLEINTLPLDIGKSMDSLDLSVSKIENNGTTPQVTFNEKQHPRLDAYELQDFKCRYVAFDINEIKQIEYELKSGQREFMIVEDKGNLLCKLCNVYISIKANLTDHLIHPRHACRVHDVVNMYHPRCLSSEELTKVSNEKSLNKITNDYTDHTKSWELCREEIKERANKTHSEIERIKPISSYGSSFDCESIREQITKNFIANHGFLPIDELLEVQFQNKEWHYMLTKAPSNIICNICRRESFKNEDQVYKHIRGEYHTKKMTMAEQIYHPKYLPTPEEDFNLDVVPSEIVQSDSHHAAQIQLPLFPQTHNIGNDWWDLKKDTNFEEFKLNYINSNVENLLRIEYRDLQGNWRFMLEDLDGDIFCILCGYVNLLDRNQMFVRAHVRGSLHMENMQFVTGIRHPNFCAIRDKKNCVAPNKFRDHQPKKSTSNTVVYQTVEEYKKVIVNFRTDNLTELLEIEFLDPISGKWKPLITETTARYVCNVCWGINLRDTASVQSHIQSNFHQNNLANVQKIHHPLKFPSKTKNQKEVQVDKPHHENKENFEDQLCLDSECKSYYNQKFSTQADKLMNKALITDIDNHVCDLACRIVFMELIFPRLARKIAENCNVNSTTNELVDSIFKDTEAFCNNGCILNWVSKGFENKKHKIMDKCETNDMLTEYHADAKFLDNISTNVNIKNVQPYLCPIDNKPSMNTTNRSGQQQHFANHAGNQRRKNPQTFTTNRSSNSTIFENFMTILGRVSTLEDLLGHFGSTSISFLMEDIRKRRDPLSETQLIAENLEFLKQVKVKVDMALRSFRFTTEKEIIAAQVANDITIFLRIVNRHLVAV